MGLLDWLFPKKTPSIYSKPKHKNKVNHDFIKDDVPKKTPSVNREYKIKVNHAFYQEGDVPWHLVSKMSRAEQNEFFSTLKDKKPTKKEVIKQYKKDNTLPETIETFSGGPKGFKRDMTGLLAYFKEMTNMERLYNELTWSIRNESSVEKYLKEANLMDDEEIRTIAGKGFSDIAGFLEDMLKIKENTELRKDFDACLEATKILQGR